MSRMNELFYMAKHLRINDDMNARQILLYVNKLLKPCEKCIIAYRSKKYIIMQIYNVVALIQRKNKPDIDYRDSENILNQMMKVKQVVVYFTKHWMKVSEHNSNPF